MKPICRLILVAVLGGGIFLTAAAQTTEQPAEQPADQPADQAAEQTAEQTAKANRRAQLKQSRALLKQSLHQLEAGNYDSALVLLQVTGEGDPKNPDVPYFTGLVRLRQGDTAQATTALTAGVENAPLSSRLKLLLARLKIAAGEFTTATDLVKQVIAIKPREGEALYLQGLLLLHQGDTTQALELWGPVLAGALARQKR